MKKTFLPIVLAALWIIVSEFVRNEFLFKSYWISHYKSLNLQFETLPANGLLCIVWGFILAYVIYALFKQLSFLQTLIVAWLPASVMIWITLYNLQVLPLKILIPAIPLSLLEVAIAQLIIYRFIGLSSSQP